MTVWYEEPESIRDQTPDGTWGVVAMDQVRRSLDFEATIARVEQIPVVAAEQREVKKRATRKRKGEQPGLFGKGDDDAEGTV